MRKLLRQVHLFLSLGLAVYVVVAGLSGSALVYQQELREAVDPELLRVPARDQPFRLDAAVEAVREAHPERAVHFVRLARERPDGHVDPVQVWTAGAEPAHGRTLVFVDPYSARILGERAEHHGVLGWLADLHVNLLAGETGHVVNGVAGILFVVVLVTGIPLWWPKRGGLRRAFRVRRPVRGGRLDWGVLCNDLHRVGGIVTVGLLLLVSVTGVALVFHAAVDRMLAATLGSTPLPTPPAVEERPGKMPLSLEALVERADATVPGAEPTWVQPGGGGRPPLVRLRFPSNPHPNGTTYVGLDPYDGRVLLVRSHAEAAAGSRLADLKYPLHIGLYFGPVGRWLTLLSGLLPTLLLASGIVMWRRRVRRRAEADERAGEGAAGGAGRPVPDPGDARERHPAAEAEVAG